MSSLIFEERCSRLSTYFQRKIANNQLPIRQSDAFDFADNVLNAYEFFNDNEGIMAWVATIAQSLNLMLTGDGWDKSQPSPSQSVQANDLSNNLTRGLSTHYRLPTKGKGKPVHHIHKVNGKVLAHPPQDRGRDDDTQNWTRSFEEMY